jgi:hypothetical protein
MYIFPKMSFTKLSQIVHGSITMVDQLSWWMCHHCVSKKLNTLVLTWPIESELQPAFELKTSFWVVLREKVRAAVLFPACKSYTPNTIFFFKELEEMRLRLQEETEFLVQQTP